MTAKEVVAFQERIRIEREDAALADLLERKPLVGAKAIIDTIARRHRIEVQIAQVMPVGAAAYAVPSERVVTLPPITALSKVPDLLATACHEFGHVLANPCTEKTPHLRDRRSGNGHCFQCEVDAHICGMSIFPYDEEMFGELGVILRRSSTRMTATSHAIEAADRLMSFASFEAHLAARAEYQRRREQLRAVERSLLGESVRAGQHACTMTGCTGRTAVMLDDFTFLCRRCDDVRMDRTLAAQRAWKQASSEGRRLPMPTLASALHEVEQCLVAEAVTRGQRTCTTSGCTRPAVTMVNEATLSCWSCESWRVDQIVRAQRKWRDDMKTRSAGAPRIRQATASHPAAERRRLLKASFPDWCADVSRAAHAVDGRNTAARARREAEMR